MTNPIERLLRRRGRATSGASRVAHDSRASRLNVDDMLRRVETGACWLLAAAWMLSATAHLSNPFFFLSSIHRYGIVSDLSARIAATVIPYLQLVLSCFLLSRVLVAESLLISSITMFIFVAAQVATLLRGLEIDCGCFGPSAERPIGAQTILTAVLLALLATAGYGASVYRRRRSLRTEGEQ